MPSSDLSRRAVAAAVAAARRHGLKAETATVLHDRWNVVVALDPEPVVIRVATLTAEARADRIGELLAQEAALIRHLARAGAPSVAPSPLMPPGPHQEDGLWLVAMARADHAPDRVVQAHALGRTLRELHVALAGFDRPVARLDPMKEVAEVLPALRLPAADLGWLRRSYERLDAVFEGLMAAQPAQPVHGDAHRGNVLLTPEGPRWTDFEEAAHGPVGWDLACLVARFWNAAPLDVEAAIAGYGRDHVADLAAWVEIRSLVGLAWGLSIRQTRGEDPSEALAWWAAGYGAGDR